MTYMPGDLDTFAFAAPPSLRGIPWHLRLARLIHHFAAMSSPLRYLFAPRGICYSSSGRLQDVQD